MPPIVILLNWWLLGFLLLNWLLGWLRWFVAHCPWVSPVHIFIESTWQLGLAFGLQFLLEPFGNASLFFIEIDLIAILMQIHVILPCLHQTVTPKVYIRFWRQTTVWMWDWTVRIVKGFSTYV